MWSLALLTFGTLASAGKVVVLPFAAQYGTGAQMSWFSVSAQVDKKAYNLTASTSLSSTWLVGTDACPANNQTCAEMRGGLFPGTLSSSKSNVAFPGYDNPTNSKGQTGKLKGNLLLDSKTGDAELSTPEVGVFTTAPPEANGYLSLPQVARGLKEAKITDSATYHFCQGLSAQSNTSSPAESTLLFGGFDESQLNLNKVQMWKMGKDGQLEVEVESMVYRWTIGGDTDNALLDKPANAIIDSTTPFVWLPKSMVDTLVKTSGATWNKTLGSWGFKYCSTQCSDEQSNSDRAVLDLKLKGSQEKMVLDFEALFKRYSLLDSYYSQDNFRILPVKALKNDKDPMVFGRAMLAGMHLWANFDTSTFALAISNLTNVGWTQSKVTKWDSESPPSLASTSKVVSAPGSPSTSSSSSPSPSDSDSDSKSSPLSSTARIGAIVGGGALLLVIASVIACIVFRRRRNQRRPLPTPSLPLHGRHELHGNKSEPYVMIPEMPPNNGPWPRHPAVAGGGAPKPPTYEMYSGSAGGGGGGGGGGYSGNGGTTYVGNAGYGGGGGGFGAQHVHHEMPVPQPAVFAPPPPAHRPAQAYEMPAAGNGWR